MSEIRARAYQPKHPLTEGYQYASLLMAENRPAEAADVLSAAPPDSPCYGLALAQLALIRMVQRRIPDALDAAMKALADFAKNGCAFPPLGVAARRTLADVLSHSERPVQSIEHYLDTVTMAEEYAKEEPEFADFLDQEKAIALTHLSGACNRLEQFPSAVTYATAARDILRKHPAAARFGMALALENLAMAHTQTGRIDPAGYAIEEALGLPDLPSDQKVRLELSKVQVLSRPPGESVPVVQRAIDEARAEQKWELAAIRCGIGLKLALAHRDASWANDLLRQSGELESKLDAQSLWPARLQFYRAELLKQEGASTEAIRRTLAIGAHHWCSRVGAQVDLSDYQFLAGQMADHFRLLARHCLDEGLTQEAFVAFEAGRARAVVAEMRNNLTHPLVTSSPFDDTGNITLKLLRGIQGCLEQDEVVVSFASLPPNMTAFVVGRDGVEVLEAAVSADLEIELRQIPDRLANNKGLRAIPESIIDIASRLAAAIKRRRVRAFVPYRVFHLVPWRALLRKLGLDWSQLGFGVCFSPTLLTRHKIDILECHAIGCGDAMGIDLNVEAEAFAREFGAGGKLTRDAKKKDFEAALGAPVVAMISCHGILQREGLAPKVRFGMSDGKCTMEEVLPAQLRSPLVILSACDSGAYDTFAGDYPAGAAPSVVLRGSSYCACTRFPIRAGFSQDFFPAFGGRIAQGMLPEAALVETLAQFDRDEDGLWRDLAAVELLIRGD